LSRSAQSESLGGWFGMRRTFLIRVNGDRFRLRYRSATFRNAFSPLLYGIIESESSGARIYGRFRIHPLARAFAWLWFSGVTIVGGALFSASVQAMWQRNASKFDGPIWVGFVGGPAMLLLGVALLRFGWSAHVRRISEFLVTAVEARVSGDEAA